MNAARAADGLRVARDRLDGCLELLAQLVETNSHADNDEGLARCHALVRPSLEDLGFHVETVASSATNPRDPGKTVTRRHLLASTPAATDARPTVLVMGHLDTVFPVEHPFQKLERGATEWNGPGVSDMKGGIVTALLALSILRDSGVFEHARFRVVLASDEEQGSTTAASVVRSAAEGVDVALCFEAARPCGGVVVARKGYGSLRVIVKGTTGHAGIAHDAGANALSALASFIVRAEAVEARFPDLSVSPGGKVLVRPTSVNSIPNHAECELEWRFSTAKAGADALAALRRIGAEVGRETRTEIELVGGVECPPMAPTPRSAEILAHYIAAAASLGMPVRGVSTAGVGDINLVAQLGAVCLDGVGPEGAGFHTVEEFVVVDSIARRAAMNAAAIAGYLGEHRARR